MRSLLAKVRLGIRSLRLAPGFAATAICTLALGIGLATAVFTVADAVVLRRLPVLDQDRIVVLSGEAPSQGMDNVPLDVEQAQDFAHNSRAFSQSAFFLYNGAVPVTIREEDRAFHLQLALVSGDYFAILGSRPLLGRPLRLEDDVHGAAPVLVLSYRAWQERFGGTPDILGRRIWIHEYGQHHTVVGVMPPGLDYPRGTEVWVPMLAVIPPRATPFLSVNVIGRLARGATMTDARNEMTAYFHREGASEFEREVRGVTHTLPDLVLGDTRPAVLAFAVASALLLLITCVNVANLLLVRGLARMREVAVRYALGATRGQVTAQLLMESALLALGGGLLGIIIAWGAIHGFVAFAPASLPRLEEIRMSGSALAGALGITTGAMLLFAAAPALLASRIEAQQALRSGTRQTTSRGARRVREALVMGQVALALLVLAAAGVVGRSLLRLQQVERGFEASGFVVAELAFQGGQLTTGEQQRALLERLLPMVLAIPGVRTVSPVSSVPYSSTQGWVTQPTAEGQSEEDAARNSWIDMEVVGPGFFATIGLPVIRGRGFTDADLEGAPPVVVLSESAAREYWPGVDPLGKRVFVWSAPEDASLATVVGIVPDTRYRDLREPHATIYYPLRQSDLPFAPTMLLIRTDRVTTDIASALHGVLEESAPGVVLASAESFGSLFAGPLAQPRMNALLLAVFAAAAVILAGIGVFGVLATMVRQRRHELGIRMALGASAGAVARLVIRRGLALTTAGLAVGLLGAVAANGLLGALLYDVSPTDTATLAGVAAVMLAVAALASLIPARASTRIDPVTALRSE